MEWLERMTRAMDYIEANLTGEIELSEAAHMACCSSYQFQRMLSFITDVTLAGYIRRRRLTLAALELQHGGAAKVMNYRIETKESFKVFGIEGVFRIDGSGEAPQTPAKLWELSHANGDVKRLEGRAGEMPSFVSQDLYPVNAVCSYRKTGPDTLPYMLCAFKDEVSNTDGYTSVTIPAHTQVIFPSEPHQWEQFGETIEKLYKRFYTEWLPTAGYEQVDGIEFEMYGARDGLNYIELWFAVRKV